jgi:hypothetical protein
MSNYRAWTWYHRGSKPLGPKLLPLNHHLDGCMLLCLFEIKLVQARSPSLPFIHDLCASCHTSNTERWLLDGNLPIILMNQVLKLKNILQTLSIWSDSASRNINLQKLKLQYRKDQRSAACIPDAIARFGFKFSKRHQNKRRSIFQDAASSEAGPQSCYHNSLSQTLLSISFLSYKFKIQQQSSNCCFCIIPRWLWQLAKEINLQQKEKNKEINSYG